MKHTNRLADYFAEIKEIATRDRTAAIKTQNEHLQLFNKSEGGVFNNTTPISGPSGVESCVFISNGPSIPVSENYMGGFSLFNGKVYDDYGNEIEFPEEFGDDGEFWK